MQTNKYLGAEMKFIGERVAVTALSLTEPYVMIGILISADSNFIYLDLEENGIADCALGVSRILAIEPYEDNIQDSYDDLLKALESLGFDAVDEIPELPELPPTPDKPKKPSFEDYEDPKKGKVQ